ncbi:MAG: DUF4271 domain-containing protein [Prolixibacteraceae bacterium]|nr:DUF4271 domain-containing protein [Prolixibacteraceae bacterium]
MAYQRDTVKINKPLNDSFILLQGRELKIDNLSPLPVIPVPERDTQVQNESVKQEQSQQPTFAQIRYRRWLQEQELLIGGSRFIEPVYEVTVDPGTVDGKSGFALPLHEVNSRETDWLTILILLVLVVFASVRNSYSKYLGHLFQSIVNYSTTSRMFREKNYPAIHGAHMLDIFFYIIFSIFMVQAVLYFPPVVTMRQLTLFFICIGITLIYYAVKRMAYKISGIITETGNEISEYLFNMDNMNRVAGLILFPVVVAGAFSPFMNTGITIYAGIFILLMLYFKLLYRGLKILFRKQFSIFYLFLYFCTLEIVPLVLLYKIMRP